PSQCADLRGPNPLSGTRVPRGQEDRAARCLERVHLHCTLWGSSSEGAELSCINYVTASCPNVAPGASSTSRTTMRLPLMRTTLTGRPASTNVPSATTSTYSSPNNALPAGRRGESAVPQSPTATRY